MNLAIDVPKIVSQIAEQYNLNLPSKTVKFYYDDSADTLYVYFEYPAKRSIAEWWTSKVKSCLGSTARAK